MAATLRLFFFLCHLNNWSRRCDTPCGRREGRGVRPTWSTRFTMTFFSFAFKAADGDGLALEKMECVSDQTWDIFCLKSFFPPCIVVCAGFLFPFCETAPHTSLVFAFMNSLKCGFLWFDAIRGIMENQQRKQRRRWCLSGCGASVCDVVPEMNTLMLYNWPVIKRHLFDC